MSYEIVPTTPELLSVLWARLWQRGLDEFYRLGVTKEQAFATALEFAANGKSGILLHDGKPICVSGRVKQNGEMVTWFQATDEFDQHVWEITDVLRQEIEDSPEMVYVYSVLCHPKAERWFRTLGLQRDGWEGQTAAGSPLYRFKRG